MRKPAAISLLGIMMGLWGCTSKTKRDIGALPQYESLPTEVVWATARTDRTSGCRIKKGELKNSSVGALGKLAHDCVFAAQWDTVEQIGTILARLDPASPWGAYYMSVAAEAKDESARATWMIELALKKAPKEGLLHFQKGRLDWKDGRHGPAIKSLETAVQFNPHLSHAYLVLGALYLREGQESKSIEHFKRALALDSQFHQAHLGLAEAYSRRKDYALALEELNKSLRLNPRDHTAWVKKAELLENQIQDHAEALVTYRRIQSLEAGRKLDGALRINVTDKVRNLEALISQRQPASSTDLKKVTP